MSLTLPVEAMSRLQVSFKVFLPDGRFSFDMASNPTPCSTHVTGLKLHFQGTHDDTGGVTFTVWASGLPENEDCAPPDSSDISHLQHSHKSSSNYLDFQKQSETGEMSSLDPVFGQTPAIIPSVFPTLGDAASLGGEGHVDNNGLSINSSTRPSDNDPREPITELMDIFDDHDPFIMGWGRPFLDDHHENSLSQYSDSTYVPEMPRIEPPPVDNRPNTPPPSLPSLPPAYDALSFVSVVGPDASPASSAGTPSSADTPSTSKSDATPASSPSESSQQDSSSPTPSDPSRPFKCLHADCPLWFKRVYTRRVHMNTHLAGSAKDRKFPCTFDGCCMQFSRKHDRLRHEVGNHGMGTQWTCTPCNKYFSSQTTLERHHIDKHESPGF
ncbi:hypothetical protein C8R44DRAFT_670778 [Mycena epipterygia]|nr:hypothetical protein C8R44DRAFT_670778 [Mycena epipterygia]